MPPDGGIRKIVKREGSWSPCVHWMSPSPSSWKLCPWSCPWWMWGYWGFLGRIELMRVCAVWLNFQRCRLKMSNREWMSSFDVTCQSSDLEISKNPSQLITRLLATCQAWQVWLFDWWIFLSLRLCFCSQQSCLMSQMWLFGTRIIILFFLLYWLEFEVMLGTV